MHHKRDVVIPNIKWGEFMLMAGIPPFQGNSLTHFPVCIHVQQALSKKGSPQKGKYLLPSEGENERKEY